MRRGGAYVNGQVDSGKVRPADGVLRRAWGGRKGERSTGQLWGRADLVGGARDRRKKGEMRGGERRRAGNVSRGVSKDFLSSRDELDGGGGDRGGEF